MNLLRTVPRVAVAAVFLGLTLGASIKLLPGRGTPTRDFMLQKLAHCQAALAGLVRNDLGQVAEQGRKLAAMSEEGAWRAIDHPEYVELSSAFRRNAQSLSKAGRDQDLDAAAVAYGRLTQSCVDCHKFVRTQRRSVRSIPMPDVSRSQLAGNSN